MTKSLLFISLLFAFCVLAGCGTDRPHVRNDEAQAAFAEVLDLYNDRLSLADEATALARAYLPTDASVLADLASARSSVAGLHATPEFVNAPALFARFDVAQRQLTDAMSQLMVACESVRRLSVTPRFRQLQARLAMSAGRIAAARDRYDSAAQRYNASLHGFPLSLAQAIHADAEKPTFPVRDGSPVHRRPRTDFGALRGSLRV